MITLAIKQATTRSKAKKDTGVEQDVVLLQMQQWVEEANAKQAAEIQVKEEQEVDLSDLTGSQ